MRWIKLLLVLTLMASCTHVEIYYSYQNTIIKRVDTDGKSTFYYLKDGKENGEIWAEYSGINDGFSGYLKFTKNGKVELLSGDGYFQIKDIDTTLFDYKSILADGRPGDEENVCKIWYPFEAEQERNRKSKTKIKMIYPK